VRLGPRLSLSFAAAIALASAISIVLVRSSIEGLFRAYLHDADARRGNEIQSLLESHWAERGSWEGAQGRLAEASERGGWRDRVVLADAEGRIVADNRDELIGTTHPRDHLAQGISITSGGKAVGTLMVGSMADPALSGENAAFLGSVTAALLWSGAAAAAVAIALGFILSAGVARPLARLKSAAARVASGDFAVRVPVSGDDEAAGLSSSFNAMAGELERLDGSRRRLIADAAHELRTPAALIQGTAEAMLDGVYPADRAAIESLLEESIRLSRLIEDLRELEALESGRLVLERSEFSLGEEIDATLAAFAREAAERGVVLEARSGGPHPIVYADRLRIGQVIRNLIRNAIDHAPAGGIVRAETGESPEGGAYLLVEDSGEGVPVEERDRIFERFYRIEGAAAKRKDGSGLGLSIAREIIRAHGGSIRVGSSELGGAAFTVSLPTRDR